jgi:peptide/nickel transport system ATP-binding protein
VLTQANILNLLKRVKHEMGTSFILITHDISTSSELADRVAVMYAGQIVETGKAKHFFPEPLHPYSQKLMASVPRLRADIEPDFIVGQPPSLINPPKAAASLIAARPASIAVRKSRPRLCVTVVR